MNVKIIEKIQKLLNLASNNGATEGERDNALRMAHGLIAKHNLSMLDVESHTSEEKREDISYAGWNNTWAKTLAMSISKLFFCKVYMGKKINASKQDYHFVGKTSSVTTSRLMHQYICDSIRKECAKNWGHAGHPQSRLFSIGAKDSIYKRVEELIKSDVVVDAVDCTSLVVNLYKNEAIANDKFLEESGIILNKTKSRRTRVNTGTDAYTQGKMFGNNVSLHNQMTGSNATTMIE